jgi:hypothetical protein
MAAQVENRLRPIPERASVTVPGGGLRPLVRAGERKARPDGEP